MLVMLNVSVMTILQSNETFFWPCFVHVINLQDRQTMYKNTSGMPKQEPARYVPRHAHGQSVL